MIRLSLATVVAVLALAPAVDASYYISKGSAELHARGHFTARGYRFAEAQCKPQFTSGAQPGFIYHRWSCNFATGDSRFSPSCIGNILITGSSKVGQYFFRVNVHSGPCPKGF
jgi:hypothetical protein